MNGSPEYPTGQTQIGMWSCTRHSALNPHDPSQGFLHLSAMHAWWDGQSVLTRHSGWQLGGEPMYPCIQEQEGLSLIGRHSLKSPQGLGWHGFECLSSGGKATFSIHLLNGSPVVPEGQLHKGLWLITWQWAPIPQTPLQGSAHFNLWQALSGAHSLLTVHSGRQSGGAPV